ncbi:MAG: alpha/beta hydrolase [Gammaproteobacteria bacterium]|nr:alpha/beta hydrolase [Gammaproteobacteria bacterium]MDH5303550.1 alpha/beta hydrolase [Gammaproteobacteria bacterium]MDH5322234.1 alpha/beta hydrolase [Gammaproteobacteria bacterium]
MLSGIDTVICVHGFWSHGAGMYLIKRRLENEYGMRAPLFNYPSVRGTLDENAAALASFISRQGCDGAHIIGHSLGGVVALRMLARHADLPPGRLVCLGSPLTGSRAAHILGRQDWAEPILGHSLPKGVIDEPASSWAMHVCALREVGVIAGNSPIGLGQLLAHFDEENDGTVSVSETQLPGIRDHLVMSVSHYGMLLSSRVVDQAAAFLRRGAFLRDI